MDDRAKPAPRRGLERRSLILAAIILAVALAVFLFSTDDTLVPDLQSSGPVGEMTDPQPVPQSELEGDTSQEPAN